jgi:hypothetical protein
VANTGAALDAEDFLRLQEAQTRGDDGRTGLGLWVTTRVLHTVGGRLERIEVPTEAFATELVASFPLPRQEPSN